MQRIQENQKSFRRKFPEPLTKPAENVKLFFQFDKETLPFQEKLLDTQCGFA